MSVHQFSTAGTVLHLVRPSAGESNAAHLQATEASTPVSPHEIMVKQGNSIPVEYFAYLVGRPAYSPLSSAAP
jgi:hypothetical protein